MVFDSVSNVVLQSYGMSSMAEKRGERGVIFCSAGKGLFILALQTFQDVTKWQIVHSQIMS